ncbi:MAG: hypothetical protein GY856_54215 [bacterium]|nr:hypothetical protein [bacterium]
MLRAPRPPPRRASAACTSASRGGFTASSLEGIVRVTAEVLAVSGVDPATLGFLEAHRTGTGEIVYRRAIATSGASSRWS